MYICTIVVLTELGNDRSKATTGRLLLFEDDEPNDESPKDTIDCLLEIASILFLTPLS